MIAIFYSVENEIGELEGFSVGEEIRLAEWQKGKHKGVVKRGMYQGRQIVLVQTGIWGEIPELGNIQAGELAEFALNKFPIKVVVIVATCGGLKKNLETGDFIICDPVCFEGKPSLFPDPKLCSLAADVLKERGVRFHTGRNLTIPFFAWRLKEKKEIAKKHPEAIIVEMEDYFIASATVKKGIPFLAIRMVVDTFREYGERDAIGHEIQEMGILLNNEFLLPFLQKL